MTYLYIHGFGGNGRGVKASLFREFFGEKIISPSLSTIPDLAIDTLEQLIVRLRQTDEVTLIGSSLGGYYAIYLAEKYAIYPYETLQRVIGESFSYYDLSSFEWNERHIAMLKNYDTHTVSPDNYLVLLQTGDELLDYTQAAQKFENSTVVVEEGGNHSFEQIETKFSMIESFAEGK